MCFKARTQPTLIGAIQHSNREWLSGHSGSTRGDAQREGGMDGTRTCPQVLCSLSKSSVLTPQAAILQTRSKHYSRVTLPARTDSPKSGLSNMFRCCKGIPVPAIAQREQTRKTSFTFLLFVGVKTQNKVIASQDNCDFPYKSWVCDSVRSRVSNYCSLRATSALWWCSKGHILSKNYFSMYYQV